MSDYKDRGELVSTSSTSIELGDEKYRISLSVRYNGRYRVHCSVLRIRPTTPHDTIDSNSRQVSDKSDVQDAVDELSEWGVERAKDQEDALSLNIEIDTTVE